MLVRIFIVPKRATRMADSTDVFYSTVPIRRGFRSLMDAAQYTPLPDDWTVGIADVVQSTKAIAEQRYKAVNMAGAAVIASVTNALGDREFPFVFGGDCGGERRRARSHHAGCFGAGDKNPRRGARRARGALWAVRQCLLRDVLR